MADGFLGVLRHQAFEFGLGSLVLEKGGRVSAKEAGEFRPGIGRAHVDDPDRLDPRPWRLNTEEARGLAALDAAPELPLRGQQQVLIERSRGVEFFDENGGGPGVRLRKRQQKKG